MDTSGTGIFSPAWWLTSVLVAFVVNIASAYARSPLDRFLASRSVRRREQQAKRSAERVARIARLRGDHHEQAMEAFAEQTARSRSLAASGFGLFLILWSSWVTVTHPNPVVQWLTKAFIQGLILLCLVVGFMWSRFAARIEKDLADAQASSTDSQGGPVAG